MITKMEEVRLLLRLSFFVLVHSVVSQYVTDNFLILTDRHNGIIWQADLAREKLVQVYSQCTNPISVSYDPVEQRVYWTEVIPILHGLSRIRRVGIDGSRAGTIYSFEALTNGQLTAKVPDGIAVDHVSRLLYYTEAENDVIGVMRLDGSYHKVLISTGLARPRAIALDPYNGWMYWTDWGTGAKIERAHMDGENRQTVADTDLSWPNGIDIDIPEQKLYWCDGNYSRIEVSDTDGSNRRVKVERFPQNGGRYFGVAVDGTKVYFTDWAFRIWVFHMVNKTGGSIPESKVQSNFPVVQAPAHLSDLHVYQSSYQPAGSNACSVNNGGCPYLCLPKPYGRTCACPDSVCLSGQSTSGNVPSDTSSPAVVEPSSSSTVQDRLTPRKIPSSTYHRLRTTTISITHQSEPFSTPNFPDSKPIHSQPVKDLGGAPPAGQPVSTALIAVSVVSVVIIIALVLLVVVIVKKRNAPQNFLPTNPHLNPAFDSSGNDRPERHLSSSPHQGDTSHYEGLTPDMRNISSKDEHPYQQMMTGNSVYEIPTVYEIGANDYQPILPSTREENV